MLIIKKGDILQATEDIICHQVNVDGVMGGGLAKQIASQYPDVERKYKNYCEENIKSYVALCGESFTVKINDNQYIANCFTQMPDFTTDYVAIANCFIILLTICKINKKTIAVPYGYGCGIANGDWNIVSKIFEDLSNEYDVDISVYKLGE